MVKMLKFGIVKDVRDIRIEKSIGKHCCALYLLDLKTISETVICLVPERANLM